MSHTAALGADTQPFFLHGGELGCVLIHGFSATPWEMRYLGERLHAAGGSVFGVQLAGHCTTTEALRDCRWSDWYTSVRDGYVAARAQAQASRIAVVGQSMGALLALKLAAECGEAIERVVLLSPALMLSRRWLQRLGPLLPALLPLLSPSRRVVHKGESDIADPAARSQSPSHRTVPLEAIHQLLRLQRHVRPLLRQVRQPVLIIHARQDHSCPLSNVGILQRALGGPVRAIVLEHSYHVISVDVEKERVADEVVGFVMGDAMRNAKRET